MTKTTKTNKKVNNGKKVVIETKTYKTKSEQIRDLFSQGKSKSEIAKIMNIRYQHVRNVLMTPLKRVQE